MNMMPLLDTLRVSHGVGPVCHELDIAPSTYYRYQNQRQHPEKRSQRDRRDDQLKLEVQRVYDENYSVYGVRKVWHQLQRESFSVVRCTIARLMKSMGLTGVRREKSTNHGQQERSCGRRPGKPSVRGRASQSAVGSRLHVREYLAGVRVCSVHHRCVCRRHRGLASVVIDGNHVRAGCAGAGAVGPSPFRHHPSLG